MEEQKDAHTQEWIRIKEEENYKNARKTYMERMFGTAVPDKVVIEEALKSAHDIRKFEIELYWKRSHVFWTLQVIIFTALGFFLQDFNTILDNPHKNLNTIFI